MYVSWLVYLGALCPVRVQNNVIAVEYALIEGNLKAIDEQLEKAMDGLNWTSQGMYRVVAWVGYTHVCSPVADSWNSQ